MVSTDIWCNIRHIYDQRLLQDNNSSKTMDKQEIKQEKE